MDKIEISDLEILAKTIYFEAGICSIFEKFYVGWIIRNRVEGMKWFGNTYLEVCLKKWQFSCWNGKTLEQIKKVNMNGNWLWVECMMAANYVISAPKKKNPIPRTYHYYQPQFCCPSWARKMKRIYPQLEFKHIYLRRRK